MTPARRATGHAILPAWAWLAAFAVASLGVTALLTAPGASVAVTIPLVAQVVATSTLVAVLWRRRRGLVPWFEIGVVYSGIVTLYGVYPLLRFLAVGEHYIAPEYDPRWTLLDPSPADMEYVGWIYVCHLVGFVATYLVVRGRVPLSNAPLRPPRTSVFLAVVALYVLVQAFWLYLGLFYDTSAGSYLESYLVSRRLPLLLAQLLNHLNGAKYPLSLVILTGLFARYSANRRYIAAWIGAIAVVTFARLGSRTELALLVLAAGMMYHTLVRPVPPRIVVAGVFMGVAGFVILGMLRGGTGATGGGVLLNPFLFASEFDVLFGNAVELARAKAAGTLSAVPWALYLADLAALLPQQIAPFEKIDPAAWYVNRFYPEYASLGGGLAFGTMAEAVITGGWFSAAVRGAALGFCFARIHRFYTRHADRYWVLVFYVWATTLSYQAFRATTFILVVLFAFRFLPVLVGVTLLAATLRRAALRTRQYLRPQAA